VPGKSVFLLPQYPQHNMGIEEESARGNQE
jgi:hypothetical protein